MPAPMISVDGFPVPRFLYGTAWKEDSTRQLTELAIAQGFRGIDTANQRRHYHEAGVGAAVAEAIERGIFSRDELFLQTKFTFRGGQNHRLPYDPAAPIAIQVEQSFASSLEHLRTDFVDSYVLHGPSVRSGLGDDDWAAWQAMEAIHDSRRARSLGVSNVSLPQLQALVRGARVPPRFVQNRCYAVRGWNRQVREFCTAHEVIYQGFSLLTANQGLLTHPELVAIANRHGRTASQIVFRFALDVGMIALTGTTNVHHMREDFDVLEFQLPPEEVQRIESLAEE